jgi:hypothetical protein
MSGVWGEPAMLVGVRTRLPRRIVGTVPMPVVLVVHVGMRVHHGGVHMLVLVALRESQMPFERPRQKAIVEKMDQIS